MASANDDEYRSKYLKLVELYEESQTKVSSLQTQVDNLTGVLVVMKEDLQIKDEQFDFLYASIRERTEQTVQTREIEEQNMRTRLEILEAIIMQRDMEKEQLLQKLSDANRKLILLSEVGAKISTCWFNTIPEEVLKRCLQYLDDKSFCIVSSMSKHFYSCCSEDHTWMTRYRRRWGKSRFSRIRKDDILNEARSWKQLFGSCYSVDENWLRHRARVFECKAHSGTITCLGLAGNRLISGSDDGSISSWEMGSSMQGMRLRLAAESAAGTALLRPPPSLPLAQLLVEQAGGSAGGGRFRQSQRGTTGAGAEFGSQYRPLSFPAASYCSRLRSLHGHGGPVWCVDLDPVTEEVISGSYDRTLKVWDAATGSCVRTLRGHTGWVSSLSLISGRSRIASASWDCTVRLWDREEGTLLRTMTAGPGNALYCIGVSGDGRLVGTGCRHAQLQIWDTETGRATDTYLGHGKEVYCVQLCDRLALSGSGDASVKIWETASGRCRMTLGSHSATVMTLQYDQEFRLVTGSYDKTVKVWDIRNTSGPASTILAHQGAVFSLKFDDYRLVTGGADHQLKVFDFSV